MLLSIPPLFGWSAYVYTPTHSFCFADWVNYRSYAYFMISCCFGIPLSVMTFCNISIIRSVRESTRKVRSTYRTTISSTINSICEEELSQKRQKTRENSTSDTTNTNPSEVTDPPDLTDNNNTQRDNTLISDKLQDAAESELQKCDTEDNKVIKQVPNLDCISDDSSNESNYALIGRQSPRRNQLFANENQNRGRSRSPFPLTPKFKPKQGTIDINLLHPRWESKQIELEGASPKTMESSVDNRSENSVTPKGTNSVKLRSPSRLRRREEVRLAVSLIIVVLLFVICWLPYCISMLISIHYYGDIPKEFHMFTLLIGYANSGCNPIVYGLMNQRFKVGFKRLFCFWRSHVFTLSSSNS